MCKCVANNLACIVRLYSSVFMNACCAVQYMRSVEPLLERAAYEELYRKAREFERQVAPRLQFWLWLKWLYVPNYVSDWWEEYIYLHGRSPIMVNSNFYAMDLIFSRSTHVPTARLANIMCAHQHSPTRTPFRPGSFCTRRL